MKSINEVVEEKYPYTDFNVFDDTLPRGEHKKVIDSERLAWLSCYNELVEPLREAAAELVHLHSCEQEGLQSGKPTFQQWFEAVNKLSTLLSQLPTNEKR